MKFFILFLVFVSSVSNGSTEPGSSGGDENEQLFQESLMYLQISLGGLSNLAKQDYVPALQLLGFLSHDLKKAESFVREYNEKNIIPKWPVPEPFESFWSMLKKSQHSPFLSRKEVDNLQLSGMFHESLQDLTKSFDLLNRAMENSFAWKKLEFQRRFEERRVNTNKKLRTPIHPHPERLTQECEEIFSDSFVPATKNPPKSD